MDKNIFRMQEKDNDSWYNDPAIKEILSQTKAGSSNTKYLIVCGSTVSGIGKGSTMSAIGILMKACGLRVSCLKIDPYLNIDAGTMSPYEHGEVFVLDDGGEVDLDLGNYERCLQICLTRDHNITSGKVFNSVINAERKGGYLGKTVQMIPHVTDKIKEMIRKAASIIVEKNQEKPADVCLIEIGGTVGDLESSIFFEAIRQFTTEEGSNNCAILLISYVPEIGTKSSSEPKTKPTQHGIKELKSLGLFPNFLVCRSEHKLPTYVMKKIANSANITEGFVTTCYNVDCFWDVPILLASQNLHLKIMAYLKLPFRQNKIHKWLRLSEHIRGLKEATEVKIGICGKYIYTTDTYYSILKSLQDASFSANRKLVIEWLDCTVLDDETSEEGEEVNTKEKQIEFWKRLEGCHGILIPGGNKFLKKYFIIKRFWQKRSRRND
jgi:CTP synthase